MKRKSNKFISLLLALTMLLNMLPLSVWADEGDTTAPPEEEQQIEQLSETDEGGSEINTDGGDEIDDTPDDNSGSEGSGKSGEQEEQVYTVDQWNFKLNDKGFAIITAYTGTFSDVNIPEEISDGEEDREVRFIGAGAFVENTTILNVTLPNTVKNIGPSAFGGCTSLTNITIPESVNFIGQNAFEGCSNLTITYLGTQSQWESVEKGTDAIPESGVTVNPVGVEWEYTYDEDTNGVTIIGFNGTLGESVEIPARLPVTNGEETNNRRVIAIAAEVFQGETALKEVSLPETIREIGANAFAGSGLTTINYEGTKYQWNQIEINTGENPSIPSTVTTINYNGNPEWEYIIDHEMVFLTGYTGIFEGEAFPEGRVTLPEKTKDGTPITHIAGQAFAERDDITELIIPEGYERINPDAFRVCPNLTKITLPLSLDGIMGFAFAKIGSPEDADQEYGAYTEILYSGSDLQWNNLDISPNAFEPYDIDEMINEGIIKFASVAEYDLSGTVKDSTGKPISGATVTLTYNDETKSVTTEENGAYLFENLSYKYEYTLTATAAGYDSRSVTMELEEDTVYDFLFYKKGNAEGELYLAHLIENEMVSFNPSLNFGVKGDRGNQIVFANTLSGLVELDADNNVLPALAKELPVATNNYMSWTFTVKDNIPWVDVNGNIVEDAENKPIYVTAADFATTYNLMSNRGTNPELYSSSLMLEYIDGVTVNGNSITFTLKKPAENFPYLLAASDFSGFYPMSQKMLDDLGENESKLDNQTMWYCGPYLLKECVEKSYKIYVPNEYYWDKSAKLFKKVTVTMVGDYAEAFELFEAGQLDYVEIDGDIAQELIDEGSTYSKHLVSKMLKPFSYQMHWNFSKRDPDIQTGTDEHDARPVYARAENWNKAIANEDFRLSLYYGMELSNYYALMNPVDPLSCENNTNSLVGTVFTTNGTDYTELVKDKLGIDDYDGKVMVRYDKDLADYHKDKAIEALKEEVTFPVSIDYYVSVGREKHAAILRSCLMRSLGDDYVTVNIHTYADRDEEMRNPQFQSFEINAWGNDYSDPYNNLAQYVLDENVQDNAKSGGRGYFSAKWNNIIDAREDTPDYAKDVVNHFVEYTSKLDDANNSSSIDERLTALSKAEAYLISNGLVTPCYLGMGYCIGYIDPDSMISDTMKNWDVRTDLVPGGEIHDNGITDYGVWKPKSNDVVFDWILTDDGTLYITGNGSLEGAGNNGNTPWQPYKNDIERIIVSPAVTGLNETGAFKELKKVTEVEFGEYTGVVPSRSTYNLRAGTEMEIQTYSILETIGTSAFEGCTSLESIKIPESVTNIGTDAFAGTGLTKIIYDGTTSEFADIDGCDDFLFDTYQNLEGEHIFADQNSDNGINIADVDLLYRMAQ